MVKKILVTGILMSVAFANVNFVPYVGHTFYKSDVRKYANYGGVYANLYKNGWLLEAKLGTLDIKYENENDYTQKNYGFGITKYFYNSTNTIQIGIVNNFLNHKQDEVRSIDGIYGIKTRTFFINKNIAIETDFYYSNYNSNKKIIQPTLKIGYLYKPFMEDEGSFYFEAGINYIKATKNDDNEIKKDKYINLDLKIVNYLGKFTGTLKYSNKSAYKVESGGFIVYNLDEEYKYQWLYDLYYQINKEYGLGVSLSYNKMNYKNVNVENGGGTLYFKATY